MLKSRPKFTELFFFILDIFLLLYYYYYTIIIILLLLYYYLYYYYYTIILYFYSIYMSIVALKRNSRRFQVPISANGFSLNGGHRNQRLVGDTNLSALYGNSNSCLINNPAVVKLSTKNTSGYLYSSVLFPTCTEGTCAPHNNINWVKSFSPEDHSQGIYIKNTVKANSSSQVTVKKDSGASQPCLPACRARSYYIGGRRIYISFNAKNSGEYGQGALSEGEYISAGLLNRKCLKLCDDQKRPNELLHTGPKALLNSGCKQCA